MSFPGSADALRRQLREHVVREPRVYVAPRTRRRLPVARLADVVVGLFADAGLYIAACPLVLGAAVVLFRDLWPVAAVGVGFFYLALTWARGQSPGMRYAGVRLLAAKTGTPPGFWRASLRAALVLPLPAAVLVLVDGLLPPDQRSIAANPAVTHTAVVLVAAGFASHFWALWDSKGRAIHDILAGVLLVEDRRHDQRPREHRTV